MLWRDGRPLATYRDHGSRAQTLAFSPDGRFVAASGGAIACFERGTGKTHVVPLRGAVAAGRSGSEILVAGADGVTAYDPTAWNGTTAEGSRRACRQLVPFTGPNATGPWQATAAALSPDGSRLVYALSLPGPTVFVVDLSKGERREVGAGYLWATALAWSPDGERFAVSTSDGVHGETGSVLLCSSRGEIEATHALAAAGTAVAFAPTGELLWASGSGSLYEHKQPRFGVWDFAAGARDGKWSWPTWTGSATPVRVCS